MHLKVLVYRKKIMIAYVNLQQNGMPYLTNVVMIGDREHDVIAAKENNIDVIGVLYGYGDREELEKSGATYIVETVEELSELLMHPCEQEAWFVAERMATSIIVAKALFGNCIRQNLTAPKKQNSVIVYPSVSMSLQAGYFFVILRTNFLYIK